MSNEWNHKIKNAHLCANGIDYTNILSFVYLSTLLLLALYVYVDIENYEKLNVCP